MNGNTIQYNSPHLVEKDYKEEKYFSYINIIIHNCQQELL